MQLTIDSLAFGGDAVGRHEGKVVFVPFGAPGDRLRVRALKEKRSFVRAELIEVLEPGAGRRTPACPHFSTCGGCQWLHVDDACQLDAKAAIVRRALRGAPAAEDAEVRPSPLQLGYRRRTRMNWRREGGALRLGYFRRASKELVDIEQCPLLVSPLAVALTRCRAALGACDGAGELELLASDEGQVHVSVTLAQGKAPARQSLEGAPIVGGTIAFPDGARSSFGQAAIPLFADDEGRALSASATVFAQANARQDRALRQIVGRWASSTGEHDVERSGPTLELFCGAGNLTQALARASNTEIVAVESSPAACGLFRDNLEPWSERVHLIDGSVESALDDLGRSKRRFELVVVDPPRQGVVDLAQKIALVQAERVIYVSCDPMTLARDIKQMAQAGWEIDRVVGLDMMPQTYHVEVVVGLSHRREGQRR